ncbi:DUF4037 domain-containing protein [Plantactinospora endophytica]|uniref:DUF4037 domain-containing protein n=1 Tax=Plantactinospora endophytica TaxID=673535 RepID=A0ABQ4ECF8_9ACTN|nr:DUF4037 domain-containing protein [Plantactinospora endophytica]GIG92418.1 hypothetical protein Pen02_73540 [Plantactinospora endophytica]
MWAPFVPGLRLCRLFYTEAVRPLLVEAFPGLRHAAARLGAGSEVLGFDTERSVDHDWGPRLTLFLSPADLARYGERIPALLAERLPKQVAGWPTHFLPAEGRSRVLAPTDGPVTHLVQVTELGAWCDAQLGFDPRRGVDTFDWLATPTQLLAEATGGAVFADDSGELTALRTGLRWYPDDVWRYLLACQWARIGEEEPFVGRAAEAGAEAGSRMLAARLVRDVMRLCLLLARRYPPYGKWLGSAFAALDDPAAIGTALDDASAIGAAPGDASAIGTALEGALTTGDPEQRQAALCTAYEAAGAWQNRLGLAAPVEPTRRFFHSRPYPVIDAGRFTAALLAGITDPEITRLPLVGGIDQYVDSTPLTAGTAYAHQVRRAFVQAWAGPCSNEWAGPAEPSPAVRVEHRRGSDDRQVGSD